MKLVGFGLKNFRSFGDEGFMLSPISKLNVVIGKNNSGKSNVLAAMRLLASFNGSDLQLEPTDRRAGFDDGASVSLKVSVDVNPHSSYTFTLQQDAPSKKWTCEPGLAKLDYRQLMALHNCVSMQRWQTISHEQLVEATIAGLRAGAAAELKARLSGLVYVPAIREVSQVNHAGTNVEPFDPSGRNIIQQLRLMQHPLIGAEDQEETFRQIQDFVASLLHVDRIRLEVPAQVDDIYVTLYGTRLPLRSYGTGLHELVLLCSTLAIYKNRWVCIEEPEIHLHPELVRRFVKFLRGTDNTYFVTTHSNVLLDADSASTVFHVQHDGLQSTMSVATTLQQNRQVVQDLAFRASDLVQANGIIWVEGPSDRIYLNKWLELVGSKLVEGIHYQILFYGGAILDHHTFSSDDPPFSEDFINVLSVNKNALVIIDSDLKPGAEKLREYKERVADEIGEDRCWITKGKEIENYLRPELINAVWGERLGKPVNVTFGKHDILQESLRAAIGKSVRYNKVRDARLLADAMGVEDLDVLDLKSWVGKTLKAIESWNH